MKSTNLMFVITEVRMKRGIEIRETTENTLIAPQIMPYRELNSLKAFSISHFKAREIVGIIKRLN